MLSGCRRFLMAWIGDSKSLSFITYVNRNKNKCKEDFCFDVWLSCFLLLLSFIFSIKTHLRRLQNIYFSVFPLENNLFFTFTAGSYRKIISNIHKDVCCSQYNIAITEQSKPLSLIRVPTKEITYWSLWQILLSLALLIKINNLQLRCTINPTFLEVLWAEMITPGSTDTEKERWKMKNET